MASIAACSAVGGLGRPTCAAGATEMGYVRDLAVGLLLGWLVSLLVALAVLGAGPPRRAASAQLAEQMRRSVEQEMNECHSCPGSAAVFRCQLFFECALKFSQADAQPQTNSLILFDHVDVCGASLIGGGLFGVSFAPLDDTATCIPAFTANVTALDDRALPVMRLLLAWIEQMPVERAASSSAARPVSPDAPASPADGAPAELEEEREGTIIRDSARAVAGELSVRLQLADDVEGGALSAAAIAQGRAAAGRILPGGRSFPQGAEIVAMDGAVSDSSLVLQAAERVSSGALENREVVLQLAFEPSEEAVLKRGPDALSVYVPPALRRQIAPARLRAPADYISWVKAMRSSARLPQLQMQSIAQSPLVFTLDGAFDAQSAEEIITLATPRCGKRLFAPFCTKNKTINLPSQARDTHRKSCEKEVGFS